MNESVIDFTRFAALRRDATSGAETAAEQTAQEFEALFIETLLKSMRETLPDGGLMGGGDDAKLYQQLFDQQLAGAIANGKGLGLASLIAAQISGDTGSITRTSTTLARAPISNAPTSSEPISPFEFVRGLWPYAKRAATALGVSATAIVSQAALETGWGRQQLQTDSGGAAHNYFGIKADSRWQGDAVARSTLEHRDGIAIRENARFRAYPSLAAAFDDYIAFVGDNPRYAAVRNSGDDVGRFADALSAAGYATDPKYAAKLRAVAASDTMQHAIQHLKVGALTPMDKTTPP
ncbi:MAG: glucosaminidase domain-containing protein [Pseudomonadota bacterium]